MTFRRIVKTIIWVPILAVLIDFALSNTSDVEVGLFPTGLTIPVPLSVAILIGTGAGFLIGGLFAWFPALRHRRAAKKAKDALRVLEAKHEELKARGTGPLLSAPR